MPDFAGRHVKDADRDIIAALKRAGRIVDVAQLNHSYPFCWRSDTPLIYRAVPSWFVKVRVVACCCCVRARARSHFLFPALRARTADEATTAQEAAGAQHHHHHHPPVH